MVLLHDLGGQLNIVVRSAMTRAKWSPPVLVVASLDKILYINYSCTMESSKLQIKSQEQNPTEKLEKTVTSKLVWIRPMPLTMHAFA